MLDNIKDLLGKYDHFILWSFFYGTAHTLFSPKSREVMAYLLSFFISVPVGTLAGALATQHELELYLVYLIVAATALLAQDVIKFVLAFGGFINDNKDTIFSSLLRKFINFRKKKKSTQEERSHTHYEEDN